MKWEFEANESESLEKPRMRFIESAKSTNFKKQTTRDWQI